MKKIILSTLLLLLGLNTAFAQEKLVDILKKLSVENKIINTIPIAEGSNYFELMQSKKNFHVKEHNSTAWYINSYKNFNIYQLVWEKAYTEEGYKEYHQSGIAEFEPKLPLLFDNEKKRCYIIEYSYSNSGGSYFYIDCIDKYNKISINPDYEGGVNTILRLNENLLPLYGTIVNTNLIHLYLENIEYTDRKEGELVALFEFKQCNDTVYRKLLNIPPINIDQVTEEELAKLLSDEHGYTEYIYPNWEEYNLRTVFRWRGILR